jgi:branched-chain amino acid transport system substrate-binding protein
MPGQARRSVAILAALLLGCTTALAAEPIRIGAISSLTGPGASSDSSRAAKAYFDAGGVHGRHIEYVVEDDHMQPPIAQQAADRLADDATIIALAGGSSVLECAVNHGRYEQAGLMSIPGAGVDPACFSTSNIAPVNAGPYASTANALSFAVHVLGRRRPCVVSPALPGMVEAFGAAVDDWTRRNRATAPPLETFRLDEPLAAVVQRVARHGCDAVVYTGPEAPAIGWVREARTAMPRTVEILLTAAYTTKVAQALTGLEGDGLYVMAEFEPWSSSSLQVLDWRALMIGNKIAPSSVSQGGYLAAQMIVRVIRDIPGPVTRKSVTRALRQMSPVRNSLAAEDFMVGEATRHNPNRSALAMQLVDGRWRVAHPVWLGFPLE